MIKSIFESYPSIGIILTCLLFLPSILSAQSTVTIIGVVHKDNDEPLGFVTVAARQAEQGKVLQGMFSDEDGKFQLEISLVDSVYLEVSMMGYVSKGKWVYPKSNADAGIIVLTSDAQSLEAVVVTAKRNKLTRKIDRLVVDVEDNAAFAGRPSLALLSSVPGVFVQDGQIAINGVYGTRVMINGRLLQLTGDALKNYLQSLKADDIKSVEVIAHPPAEYDAEGAGGLINIILKKNADAGFTANIGTDYSIGLGRYPSYRPNVSLDYRKGKLNMSGGYDYFWEKGIQSNRLERDLPDNGRYFSSANSITNQENHNVRLSAVYDINEKQFVGIDYSGTYGRSGYDISSVTRIEYSQIENNVLSSGEFPFSSATDYTNVGLNYVLKTDTLGSNFIMVADVTHQNNRGQSGTFSETFASDGRLLQDTAFTFLYPSISRVLTGQMKYDQKFRSGASIYFGGKISSNRIRNVNNYDFENGQPMQHAFDYNYDENVYAGFISINGVLGGMEYNIGVRGEQSVISGDLLGSYQDTSIRSNYFNIFPNISLQHTWDKKDMHKTTLSYSKRISRPSFQQLNPFQYFIDNYSVETGNPYLTPQFRQSIELSHLFRNQYNVSISYTNIQDVINQVFETNEASDLITVLWRNSGTSDILASSLSFPIKIAKWWTTTNNLQLTNTHARAPEFNLKLSSFEVQTEQDITLSKSFGLNLSAFYTPRHIMGNIVTSRIASVDFGVRKSMFKDRLTANINLSDIFYTNNIKQATSYFDNDQIHLQQLEQSRVLTFSLRYHLNMGKTFKARKLEKSNADEKGRL